jgi:nucleoside-diphosphate-sugar epimerase
MPPNPSHVVLGCNGPVGLEVVRQLHDEGHTVRGVCRSGLAQVPEGVEVVAGDAADSVATAALSEEADAIICCVGVDYTRWPELWPPIIHGLIEGCSRSGAKLVFADNLYAYGPVNEPLREALSGTSYGVKPALRARLASELLKAHTNGRLRVAIARASDFYGPGVTNAMLGERVFPAALAGRSAQLLGDIDQPHTYTYAPDFARALVTLAERDEGLGQVWHVPNAPALSTREVVTRIFAAAGHEPRVRVLPGWLLSAVALFSPLLREVRAMGFLWDRPYVVDHTKFAQAFDDRHTPFDEGIRATLDWYRARSDSRVA